MTLWTYRARLRRVIDADTCEIVADCGFHSHHVERVRLAGIDAPERSTPEGKAATAFVVQWFADAMTRADPQEWPLIVRTRQIDSRHGVIQDASLGRYIAEIFDERTGRNLSDDLIAAGHAKARA